MKTFIETCIILFITLFMVVSLLTCHEAQAYELKDGASIEGLKPEISEQLPILEIAWLANVEGAKFVITSGTESGVANRYTNSLHNIGLAIDIRTITIFKHEVLRVSQVFKLLLGVCYDVIVEKDHIHIEYDEHNGRCGDPSQCVPFDPAFLIPDRN